MPSLIFLFYKRKTKLTKWKSLFMNDLVRKKKRYNIELHLTPYNDGFFSMRMIANNRGKIRKSYGMTDWSFLPILKIRIILEQLGTTIVILYGRYGDRYIWTFVQQIHLFFPQNLIFRLKIIFQNLIFSLVHNERQSSSSSNGRQQSYSIVKWKEKKRTE